MPLPLLPGWRCPMTHAQRKMRGLQRLSKEKKDHLLKIRRDIHLFRPDPVNGAFSHIVIFGQTGTYHTSAYTSTAHPLRSFIPMIAASSSRPRHNASPPWLNFLSGACIPPRRPPSLSFHCATEQTPINTRPNGMPTTPPYPVPCTRLRATIKNISRPQCIAATHTRH